MLNFSNLLVYRFEKICLEKSLKKLTRGISKNAGRSKYGFILAFKKSKKPFRKLFRFVDFWRRVNCYCYVLSVSYDPNRSSYISLVCYLNGLISYVLHVHNIMLGYKLYTGVRIPDNNDINKVVVGLGNSLLLKYIPVGTLVSSIELWPGKGMQLCRSAGMYAMLVSKNDGLVLLKLNSGWRVLVSELCMAVVGIVSNIDHKYKRIGKAGKNRNLGRKQTVRGVAMNSVDHPHGGGRGKSAGTKSAKSPWGKEFEFKKTSRSKRFRN